MRLFHKLALLSSLFLVRCATPEQGATNAPPLPLATRSSSSKNFQTEFLRQINKVRTSGCNCGNVYMPPADPLSWNYQLETAARLYAHEMAANNFFSHTGLNGSSSKERIMAQGYTIAGFKYIAVGENIGRGQLTITEIMQGWIKSPGHCRNIMNPNFKEVGVAVEKNYWVQDFGGRRK